MPAPRFLWPALAGLCAVAAIIAWLLLRLRISPQERERRRRIFVHLHGRLADATITDFSDSAVFYGYMVAGVEYSASQDIAPFRDSLPADFSRLLGPAMLKYMPANPANSILICEDWSGLRLRS